MNLALQHAQAFARGAQRQYIDIMEGVVEPPEFGDQPERKPQHVKTADGWKIEVSNDTPHEFVATFTDGHMGELQERPF